MHIKQLWQIPTINESGTEFDLKFRFLADSTSERFTDERKFTLRGAQLIDVSTKVAEFVSGNINGYYNRQHIILGRCQGHECLVFLEVNRHSQYPSLAGIEYNEDDDETVLPLDVQVVSHRSANKAIFEFIDKQFKDSRVSKIRWWYKGNSGGAANRTMFLDKLDTKLLPEFYPYLPNPQTYLEKFLTSKEAVLLVAGDPGTGKTTLIRHLICDFNITADILYDEALMENDAMFQDFLFNNESKVLIIEDADAILTAREDTFNPLMARFLNISDGIVKLPSKKLVFTTNLSDFNKVDPALIRPGRCYDVLQTKALTHQEAILAAKVAGLRIPFENRNYTLAELFSNTANRAIRKLGF